ncbi:ENTH-domain-containing protein [Pluteus cervinus]|uniref:ENTH-domain-containing protein n=1 Tax=Pluteus cervinus TaxID=181527 RepID=A0ACD3AUG4_9AGAR|nr:ENTH-domain-containing protein [Pluteus cervinus]
MQHFGKAALRVTKNYTKGYSDTQAKVREATSNDPWGPSGTQMNEIAQLTYNQGDFVEIMEMLDKRLNDKGKNWRHVFKSLTVLDYCLHQGSENVVIYFRDNIYVIKTLKEFQFVDEDGKDQGANVRQKAKDITNLLQDEARLREERRARASMRDRMIGGSGGHGDDDDPALDDENAQRRQNGVASPPRRRTQNDDDELRRAIEESKRTLMQEQVKAEEKDLAEAIRQSEEDERNRTQAISDTNASALFDDQNQLAPPQQQAAPLVAFGDQNPYSTMGLQPQYTSIQPQFTVQPQFTSFNPYQQQMEQEALQAEYIRQQQAYIAAAQQEEMMRQQMQLQQMQQQQQQQQSQSLFIPQQLVPQPTGFGSNNPFAPASASAFAGSPGLTQKPSVPSFNLQGTYESHDPSHLSSLSSSPRPPTSTTPTPSASRPIQVKTKKELGENEQHLASLFANRDDGMDTFGNVGALRYGHADGARLATQRTGNNPFSQQQQQGADQPFFTV